MSAILPQASCTKYLFNTHLGSKSTVQLRTYNNKKFQHVFIPSIHRKLYFEKSMMSYRWMRINDITAPIIRKFIIVNLRSINTEKPTPLKKIKISSDPAKTRTNTISLGRQRCLHSVTYLEGGIQGINPHMATDFLKVGKNSKSDFVFFPKTSEIIVQ